MKKLLKVSMVAMLVAAPFAANATLPAAYSDGSTSTKPTVAAVADVASTSYVKGAYDTAIGYINELNTAKLDASTASSTYATQTALTDGLAGKQDTIDAQHKLSASLVDGALTSTDIADMETQTHAAATYATQTALTDGLAAKQNTIDANNTLSGAYLTAGTVAETALDTATQTKLNNAAAAKKVTVHTTWGTDSATAPADVLVNAQ